MEAHYNVMLRYFFTVLSFVSISASAEPPFGGTIFIDPDIITESDPTTFVSIEAAGQDLRTMYDRRSGWIENNAFLFEANFSDSLSSQVQVNSEFETASAAAIEAEKYAIVIGRLPKALRVDVATYWIHKGVEPFGGGNNNLLIHVGQADLYVADGILEETFVHEAAHTSLDAYHASSAAWLTAQEADGEFISTYAEDNPTREDIAESFLPYLAVEFRADRISEDLAETITNTIPNRIAFFNSLDLDLAPITTTSVDSDGDGIGDGEDNCPEINNVDQLNSDSDELGNACDEDDDNDGLADTVDAFPLDFSEQLDTDQDGVGDNSDVFPNDPELSSMLIEDALAMVEDLYLRECISASHPNSIEVADISSLECWYAGIENLKGLEHFTFSILRLGGNEIRDLSPLVGQTKLIELILWSNEISEVASLTGLSTLSTLNLRSNQLTDLSPLSALTDLSILELGANKYSDLNPLAGLTNLTELRLGNSQINDISALATMTDLKNLWLNNSQVSDLSALAGLTSLENIHLHYNLISDLSSLASLVNLQGAGLFGNLISDLGPLAGLTNLRILLLMENQIHDLYPLGGLTNLTHLYLHHNQIADLSPLSGLTNLYSLSLSQNQIHDLYPLGGLINLSRLKLSDNQITDLNPLVELDGEFHHLELGQNPIGDFSPLAEITSLNNLYLDDSAITDLYSIVSALVGLPHFNHLSLNNNQITDLTPLAEWTNLIALSMNDNRINDLSPLAEMTNLQYLYLDNNQINDLSSLAELIYLRKLSSSNNQITDLSPLAELTNLSYLQLSDNQITDLSILGELPLLDYLGADINNEADLQIITDLTGITNLIVSSSDLANSNFDFLTNSNLDDFHCYSCAIGRLDNLLSSLNPQLGSLFLEDHTLTDLSPLGQLEHLYFLELKGSLITDLSPLFELNILREVFIYQSNVSDLSFLEDFQRNFYIEFTNSPLFCSDVAEIKARTYVTLRVPDCLSEEGDADADGVTNRLDPFPLDATESADTDGDGTGDNADLDDDNDGYSDEQEAIDGTDPLNPFSCSQGCFSFDIDNDLDVTPLTDGLLVIRHLFGFSGESLIAGAASLNASTDIKTYLTGANAELDIDGDGQSGALTDGLLLIRYLFGFSGDSLISGAVSENAERTTAEQIETYISERIPIL